MLIKQLGVMKLFVAIFSIVVLSTIEIFAVPQYSLITGNRCVNCHTSANGGGMRDMLGWYSNKDVGIIRPESIGMKGLYDLISESNEFFEDRASLGLDFRYLSAKLGGPAHSEREYFVMQATPYLKVKPAEWISLQGHYNFSDRGYPGQEFWSASAKIQPGWKYPELEVGYLRPAIGLRQDDHTSLTRQVAGDHRANQLIPPDYAEIGAELNYYAKKWFNVTLGAYGSENLSENYSMDENGMPVSLADKTGVSGLIKLELWPRFSNGNINTVIGGAYFFNGDYKVADLYAGIGLTDKISLIGEYVYSSKGILRAANNYAVDITYQYAPSAFAFVRFEEGNTNFFPESETVAIFRNRQYVFGLRLFLFPFVEFRPEYRIFDRTHVDSYASQYVLQLHVFY